MLTKNQPIYNSEEDPINPPNANWLSTITRIGNLEWYVLLTSDCEKFSLIRIDKKEQDKIKSNLILAQSPHHGSFKNHNSTFWKKRNKNRKAPIVFSSGENSYGHPNGEVVRFFIDTNYDVRSTNSINGINSILNGRIKSNLISDHLDLFSIKSQSVSLNSKYTGDQVFTISSTGTLS